MILILSIAQTAYCTEQDFEFKADKAPAQDVARAIGEFFKVSIFVDSKVADREVTAYLREGVLEDALDALSFHVQAAWRRNGKAVYIGDEEKERYFAVPSAGLDAAAIKVIFPQSVLSGDTILVKSKPTEFSQMKGVIETMQKRHQFTARLLICDVGSSYRDPVNTFMGSIKLGVTASGDLLKSSNFQLPLSINDVYDFLKTKTDVRIKTYTDLHIASGEPVTLTAGNVLERQIFIRPTETTDGSNNTLVTRYDRLQLGLTVSLAAFFYDDRWFVRYDISDADYENSTERKTADKGGLEIRDNKPVTLATLNRDRATDTRNEVKGLGKIPLVGRAFRSKGADGETRVLYIFIQWLGAQEEEKRTAAFDNLSMEGRE
ncbi:MAG: FecR domain-containing protein [Opitutaceae bacterium]